MELDFFLEKAAIDPSLIHSKWVYPAASGFIQSTNIPLAGISGDQDFSLLFTFQKANATKGTIVSNYTGGNGFAVGFNDNNELFCSTSGEFYTFNSVRLAQKNCLGITKQGKNISVYKYDIFSSGFNRNESYTFSQVLSGGQYRLGNNPAYLLAHSISGISGRFDQLIYVTSPLSQKSLDSAFSGFLPITYTINPTYSLEYENEDVRKIDGPFVWNSFDYSQVKSAVDIINSYVIAGTGSQYNGVVNGNVIGNIGSFTGSYWGVSGLCQSGAGTPFSFTSGLAGGNNGNYSLYDTVKFTRNSSNEYLFSHQIRIVRSGITGFVDHDLYQHYKTGSIQGVAIDSGYWFSGFNMSGAVIREDVDKVLRFELPSSGSWNNGLRPTQMNNWAIYDPVNQNYFVNGLTKSGAVYYGNYGKLDPLDYEIVGERAYPQGVVETYHFIYDLNDWIAGYTSNNVAGNSIVAPTGFPAYGSVVKETVNRRYRFQDYYETSNLHLSHGKTFYFPNTPDAIFNNDERFWQ